MTSSPIAKKVTLPDNWVHLQKTMIPDQATACYWSVWYDIKDKDTFGNPDELLCNGTAWLMWCPIGDDPSLNDSWAHAEDLDGDCKNALTAIESVYGVSFHESIWVDITPEQMLKDNPIV